MHAKPAYANFLLLTNDCHRDRRHALRCTTHRTNVLKNCASQRFQTETCIRPHLPILACCFGKNDVLRELSPSSNRMIPSTSASIIMCSHHSRGESTSLPVHPKKSALVVKTSPTLTKSGFEKINASRTHKKKLRQLMRQIKNQPRKSCTTCLPTDGQGL